jgi:hypothetical protein
MLIITWRLRYLVHSKEASSTRSQLIKVIVSELLKEPTERCFRKRIPGNYHQDRFLYFVANIKITILVSNEKLFVTMMG